MKKKPILSFTVDTKKWRCGSFAIFADNALGEGTTELLNKEGYKCCLGFACQQAGYKGKLREIMTPGGLKQPIEGLSYRSDLDNKITHTEFTVHAMRINDSTVTTVEEKKAALIALGKKHNIEVKFK